MLPQVRKRQIGKIKIIDIQGDLVGPWAMKAKNEIHSILAGEQEKGFVINLKELREIDSLGVKAITESVPENRKAALLNGSLSVMDMIHTIPLPERFQVLHNEEDLVSYFGHDLIVSNTTEDEKRKHSRLMMALPVTFTCLDPQGQEMQFQAIATSLSEGGMFAEYINVEDAHKSQDFVNPYELKMLTLKVKLFNDHVLTIKGKVVRRKLDGDQVGIGIEFYQISESDRTKIKNFLAGADSSGI